MSPSRRPSRSGLICFSGCSPWNRIGTLLLAVAELRGNRQVFRLAAVFAVESFFVPQIC